MQSLKASKRSLIGYLVRHLLLGYQIEESKNSFAKQEGVNGIFLRECVKNKKVRAEVMLQATKALQVSNLKLMRVQSRKTQREI